MRIFRRYANEHRFFEVILEELAIRRRVGLLKASQDASVHVEHHRSPIAAREAYDAMCAVYVDRGMRLVNETIDETVAPVHVADPARFASDEALERECVAAPESAAPWSVYADWLMGQGDPRGQLAALQLAGKRTEVAGYLETYADTLLGGFTDAVELAFRHGFAVGARIKTHERGQRTFELVEITRALLELPIARFIHALRFGLADRSSGDNDWGPTLAAIIASPRAAQITELRFDDYTSDDNEISWTPFGDLSAIGALPQLEVLHLRSGQGGAIGPFVLPALREYVRVSGGLDPEELADLARSNVPELERLTLWLGTPNYGGNATLADLEPFLDGACVPALRHLGLANSMLTTELVPALARSAILPRLRSLDLSGGTLMARGAAALIEHAGAFRHLESIDLDDNQLAPGEVARIVAVLPQVRSAGQRDEDRETDADGEDPAGDDEARRYVTLGE